MTTKYSLIFHLDYCTASPRNPHVDRAKVKTFINNMLMNKEFGYNTMSDIIIPSMKVEDYRNPHVIHVMIFHDPTMGESVYNFRTAFPEHLLLKMKHHLLSYMEHIINSDCGSGVNHKIEFTVDMVKEIDDGLDRYFREKKTVIYYDNKGEGKTYTQFRIRELQPGEKQEKILAHRLMDIFESKLNDDKVDVHFAKVDDDDDDDDYKGGYTQNGLVPDKNKPTVHVEFQEVKKGQKREFFSYYNEYGKKREATIDLLERHDFSDNLAGEMEYRRYLSDAINKRKIELEIEFEKEENKKKEDDEFKDMPELIDTTD
jgi:hypothetical protein